MIPMFIASTLFLAFALYNWFFILKKMDKATFRRTTFKTLLCIVIAVIILGALMALNLVSGI